MKALSILALLVTTQAFAQDLRSNNSRYDYEAETARDTTATKLWIKAGPGFSTMTNTEGGSSRTGLNFAAEFDFSTSENFSVQTGVGYIQRGITFSGNDSGVGFDATAAVNYIQIPLLAKFKAAGFALTAGPYAAFAVNRTAEISVQGFGGSIPSQDISSSIKAFDYGARFGVAYEAPIANTLNFSIGANYDLGLANISTSDEEAAKGSNRTLAANVGLGVQL